VTDGFGLAGGRRRCRHWLHPSRSSSQGCGHIWCALKSGSHMRGSTSCPRR